MNAVGSGAVQEKQQAYLVAIIEKANGLFEGEFSDGDQVVYMNGLPKEKLLGSETLIQQATNKYRGTFGNPPELSQVILTAIMDALEDHQSMSNHALGSERVRKGGADILLGPG